MRPSHAAVALAACLSVLPAWGLPPLEPAEMSKNIAVQMVTAIPEATPSAPDQIFCSMSSDGWPEGGRSLRRVAPGLYAATIDLPRGETIEYKFLRESSWETVEKNADGAELPNRKLFVPKEGERAVVLHHVARWADREPRSPLIVIGVEPQLALPQSTRTGDIRVHENFTSPGLSHNRDLIVYLPPGYDDDLKQRFPVLYMHDGQNLFDARTSFSGTEWEVDEAAEKLIKAGKIRKCIIVGINNTPDRMQEYTPFEDATRGGGQGDAYLKFIVRNVKPFIDRTYRTKPEREYTYLAGSSLGGLISLYAACEYGDTFSRFGVVSPSLQWADYRVMDLVGKARFPDDVKMWVEVGLDDVAPDNAKEPKESPYTAACRKLARLLEVDALMGDRRLHYAERPGIFHSEAEWQQRTPAMLEFLIGTE